MKLMYSPIQNILGYKDIDKLVSRLYGDTWPDTSHVTATNMYRSLWARSTCPMGVTTLAMYHTLKVFDYETNNH